MDIRGWVSEHPSTEFAAAGVLVGAHLLVSRKYEAADWLSWITTQQRVTVYSTGAAVISILGGLCAIGISVMLSGDGARSQAVRRLYGQTLRRNWRGLLAATFLAALLCLVAQTLDGRNTTGPTYGRWVFEFALVLAALSLVRVIWLFDRLVAVSDLDVIDVPRQPAPGLRKQWQNPGPGGPDSAQRATG